MNQDMFIRHRLSDMIELWETNMYNQTDIDGINFDHRLPRAGINSYKSFI